VLDSTHGAPHKTQEAILSALLERRLPASLSYVTGLKSLRELRLTPRAAQGGVAGVESAGGSGMGGGVRVAAMGGDQPGNDARFVCPVTGLEMNGRRVRGVWVGAQPFLKLRAGSRYGSQAGQFAGG
jgi:hypothetical protein